jgi:hypothetical protein
MAASLSKDTLSCNSLSTEKIMNLRTGWSESSNAASLTFFDFKERLGQAYFGFNNSEGNYRLFQYPEQSSQYGFFTNGYAKQGKWKFYGNFDYYHDQGKNIKWVDVVEPYNDNPYTVGDSIGGKYIKEYFKMQGKGAYKLSDLISFGFDIKYNTGVGTKRKDPRPINTITSFDFRPGIVFNLREIKAGANLRYQEGKEDIDFETVTDRNFDLFYFKGLGVYSSTIEKDSRYTEMNLYGGGLQFSFENKLFRNITEVNFDKKTTDIKRGKSVPLQIVFLDDYNTEVSSTFIFAPSDKKVSSLGLSFRSKNLYGQEPVVEPKLEQVSYQWSTAAKYTLYWNESREYGIDYSYYKIIDRNHFNWGGTVSGKLTNNTTTYYFVPEFNRQNLNLIYLNAMLEKGIQFNSGEIVIALNGTYRKSYDSKLELVEDETLLSTVNTEFVTHDFNYYSSGLWLIGTSAKIGKNISIYQSPMEVFLEAGYMLMISNLPENPERKILEVKLGMNF